MTNTPTPRPDVATLKARLKTYGALASCDIRALIRHIEALEERMGKLEAVAEAARGIADHITKATFSELDDALAALDSPEEQKAMEPGDDTGENHE